MQTDLTPENGNCFSACVASILEIDIAQVPNIAKDFAWFQIMDEFVNKYGYGLTYLGNTLLGAGETWREHAYIIAGGQSPRYRNRKHVVIYKNGKMVHDPHPDNIGLKGEPEYYLLFVALDAKAKK